MGILRSSWSVLTNPSPENFDAHKRDSLSKALIYVFIGAIVAAIVEYLGFGYHAQDRVDAGLVQSDVLSAVLVAFGIPVVLFFFVLVVVYFAGRMAGGTGHLGEIAYTFALFWAPLMMVRSILWLPAVGGLGWLAWLAWIIVLLYFLLMAYGAIQSGMHLSGGQAVGAIIGVAGVFLTIFIIIWALYKFVGFGDIIGNLSYLMF